jgi:phage FluMu protein Com
LEVSILGRKIKGNQTMNIKCPLCDFENEEGSKFCKNCNELLSKQDYSKK